MKNNNNETKLINKLRSEGKTLSEIATTINRSISYVINRVNVEKKIVKVSPDLMSTLHNNRLVNTIKNELDFKCQICGADDIPLNLHHKFIKLEPYKKVLMITLLCDGCHISRNKKEVEYKM